MKIKSDFIYNITFGFDANINRLQRQLSLLPNSSDLFVHIGHRYSFEFLRLEKMHQDIKHHCFQQVKHTVNHWFF